MAVTPPESKLWWNEPVGKAELVWIAIAFVWSIFMFGMMVWWHIEGDQNLSNEVYRIDPEVFAERAEAFTEQYQIGEEGESGYPLVHPPPGSDIYQLARLWEWWPVLELEKDQTYRLHLSSLDWQHGWSLQPTNINVQVHPGIEHVITLTPTETGVFSVVCNEFCGAGHHTMVGRIRVVESGNGG